MVLIMFLRALRVTGNVEEEKREKGEIRNERKHDRDMAQEEN